MRTVLITYLIVINLISFLLMGIDKRRAIKNKWRISEKTLFLTAFLFGSVGAIAGMYVFRHKTLHRSFRFGLPAILIAQICLVVLGIVLYHRAVNAPVRTVRRELQQIKELDAETIQSFIYYEDLMGSLPDDTDISETCVDVVRLFFQKFDYHIQSAVVRGDQATVQTAVTNVDMHALAQDLCKSILQNSVSVYPESTSSTPEDYYRLLGDALTENSYELATTTAVFHLQKDSSGWTVRSDETLEDELVGGFISYMNDPYILSASTALSIQLDALKALTAEQWADYLSVNDLFATYNTDYYQAIDEEYIRQLANAFDYEILRCTENGSDASAAVRITSIDMKNVLAIYKEHLLAYAATARSLRDDDVQFSNETSRLLLQSLQENTEVASTDIDIHFHNNGSIWEISFDQEFTNALMGNMSGAIDQFNSVTHDADSVIVAPVN